MAGDPVITTDRLALRVPTIDDIPAFASMFADERVYRYVGGERRSAQDLADRLQKWLRYHEHTGWILWALVERETGTVIGDCGLIPIANRGADASDPWARGPDIEIGYRLGHDHWGKGYATEAARATVRYAFEQRNLDRIIGVTHPDNTPSGRVLTKCGMRLVGPSDDYYNQPVTLYELTRAQWEHQAHPDG